MPRAYKDAITGISKSVAERFSDLEIHPVFRHLIPILDCRKWPSNDEAILRWGDDAICELYHHFKCLLRTLSINVMRESGGSRCYHNILITLFLLNIKQCCL